MGALIITFAMAVVMFSSMQAQASAPSGLAATVASSSVKALANVTAEIVMATSTNPNCAARIVTTQAGNGVMMTFSDQFGEVPSATRGVFQTGSTTVAYDGAIYGCRAIKAFGGTQTLYIMETQ